MEKERARAILESPETIYVTYQNLPVWIENVQADGATRIRDLNSDLQLEVPATELLEIGPGQEND
ncbi:H-type small acid-soluble spore protein [Hydrogenispora ethanolica]|jgi:H-type small acid-soluble spore protein|uniref:H-type small acid-soluble spore protein n=1 Tax=Hydrogenispora ethanolica TaxID=1082276 RepID=A0A4R1S7L4_HYDET|nr:small, acid-soluble spore protein, H family [Hydrogenispora ethanolica]TCL75249.1 H-type small acid-soluble spore protein [Hydrogenispora ethanolica]